MTIKFNGRDVVAHFKEDPDNTAVRQYRVEYECRDRVVTHYVKAEDNQGNDAQGLRLYRDVLSYGENEAAGITRQPRVTFYSQNADLKWSGGVVIDAQNPIPVLNSAPVVTSTLDGVEIALETPADADWEGYVAWVGTSSDLPLDASTERYRGKANRFTLQLPDDDTYYLRVAPYDAFGLDTFSAWDAQPIQRGDLGQAVEGVLPASETIRAIDAEVASAKSDANQAKADANQAKQQLADAKTQLEADVATVRTAADQAKADAAQVRTDLTPDVNTAKQDAANARSDAAQARTDLASEVARAQLEEGAIRQTVTNLTQTVGDNNSAVSDQITILTGADSALATRAQNLETSVNNASTGNTALDARLKTEITARATADQVATTRITSMEGRVGAPEALNNNAAFTSYVGSTGSASGPPSPWIANTAYANGITSYAGSVGFIVPVFTECYFTANFNSIQANTWVVVEMSINTQSGDLRGAGAMLSVGGTDYKLSLATDPDITGKVWGATVPTNGQRLTFRKLIKITTGDAQPLIYCASRAHFLDSANTVSRFTVTKCQVRHATQAEVDSNQAMSDAAAAKADAATALTNAGFAVSKINEEVTTRTQQNDALSNRLNTLEAQVGGSEGSSLSTRLTNEETARATGDTALGNRIATIEATYIDADDAANIANAKVADEATARSNADGALSSRIGSIEADYVTGSGANSIATTVAQAKVADEATARSNADGALSNRIGSIEADYVTNGAAGTIAQAKVNDEATTRANADGALGNRIGSIEADYVTNGAAASIAQAKVNDEATVRSNADGALGNRISSTEAKLAGGEDSWLAARIRDEATASANRDTAIGNRTATLETSMSRVPETWRVKASGNGANRPANFGDVGVFEPNGTQHGGYARSYTVHYFNDGVNTLADGRSFDVYGNGEAQYTPGGNTANNSAAMAAFLNAIPAGRTVIVYTADEPAAMRHQEGLLDAMRRCGAGEVFESSRFRTHSAYILIGKAGAGRGNGMEHYAGTIDVDPMAWLEVPFTMVNGRAVLGGQAGAAITSARLSDEETARSNADSAIGNRVSDTEAKLAGGQDSWLAGRVRDEATASANRDSALGNRISTTEAQFRGEQDSALKTLINNKRSNLALVDWWKMGASIPWWLNGGQRNEIVQFPHGSNFNSLAMPDGSSGDAWLCQADASGGGAGGWDGGTMAPLDPDKTYRFMVPIAALTGSLGTSYWGTSNVCDLNTGNHNPNPYFAVASNLPKDRWHLFVGYVFPRNSVGKTNDGAGVWDMTTGNKVIDGSNYCFNPDGRQISHRAYQYYAQNGSYQAFGRPIIELVDGSEANIQASLSAARKANQVDARVTDEATASANRDSALGNRISSTEAKLNGGEDSWLAARVRDEATASANRDTALGNRTSVVEASATASTSAVTNDKFALWPDGQRYPTTWTDWVAYGPYAVTRVSGSGSPYAVRTTNDAGHECGFCINSVPTHKGKWVVEVTVRNDGGSLSGAGVTLSGIYNIDFLSDPDTNGGVGESAVGETRTWVKLFDIGDHGALNVHAMHGWSGFNRSIASHYLVWYKLTLRPASPGDIAGVKNAADIVAANARIGAEETARANSVSAVASRTSVVEAQVSNDSNNLVRNGFFNAPGWGQFGAPPHWGVWSQDNGAHIGWYGSGGSKYGAPYPLQIDRNGNNNGVSQNLGTQAAGWYVLEADITAEDGNWLGCGIHINFNNGYSRNFSFGAEADTNGGVVGHNIGSVNRKFSTMFYNGAVGTNVSFYLMAGWTGFASDQGFLRTIWHKAVVRAATDGEIKGQKAQSSIDGVSARVSTTESAISNLNGRAASYWQVQSVAGNNRAQITVRSDSNGGAGVDIVGDVNFSGNLNVGPDSGERVKITNQGVFGFFGNGNPSFRLGRW